MIRMRAALIAIFLGAVGSGVWELFLGDIVRHIFSWAINVIVSLSDTYLDYLHERIGYATKVSIIGLFPYYLVMAGIIVFPWVYLATNISQVQKTCRSRT